MSEPIRFNSPIIGPNPKNLEKYNAFCNRMIFCDRDFKAIKCGSGNEICVKMNENEIKQQIPLKYLMNVLKK